MSIPEAEVEVLDSGPLVEAIRDSVVSKDGESVDENEITEAWVIGDDEIVASAADVLTRLTHKGMRGFNEGRVVAERDSVKTEVVKTATGTTQQTSELGHAQLAGSMEKVEVVEPPYPPELLSAFLEVDETHFRCVRTKVTDSVGRDYQIVPMVTVRPDDGQHEDAGRPVPPKTGMPPVPVVQSDGLEPMFGDPTPPDDTQRNGFKSMMAKAAMKAKVNGKPKTDLLEAPDTQGLTGRRRVVDQAAVDAEAQLIEDFVQDANDVLGFEGVLDRACMDYEGIGWAAIEVIRSLDMKVRRIAHIPAPRVRVLKGWRGFVEIVSSDRSDGTQVTGGTYVYYQMFGQKVVSKRQHPVTGKPLPYDPAVDGELSPNTCQWHLVDRETGQVTADTTKAANEIIWVPRHHANTIYYGYSDIVSALGWLLANVHIRDYLLQFFEHNTVPRYAIVIEGAKLAEGVRKLITQYFSTHVKGKAHKTLIIPIPAMRGEVKLRFEKLDADTNEGSFQDTKKNNAQAIMCAHGVSPAIIGIAEHSELGSGKGLSQAEIYKDRIISPSQRNWATKLNRMLRLGLGIQLVSLKFNPLDIRDETGEMGVLTGYLLKGCITINQIRKKAGLGDPIEGGDRAFIVIGSTIIYVDEMTEAVGTEKQKLLDQIDKLKMDFAVKQASQTAARSKAATKKPAAKAGVKKKVQSIGQK